MSAGSRAHPTVDARLAAELEYYEDLLPCEILVFSRPLSEDQAGRLADILAGVREQIAEQTQANADRTWTDILRHVPDCAARLEFVRHHVEGEAEGRRCRGCALGEPPPAPASAEEGHVNTQPDGPPPEGPSLETRLAEAVAFYGPETATLLRALAQDLRPDQLEGVLEVVRLVDDAASSVDDAATERWWHRILAHVPSLATSLELVRRHVEDELDGYREECPVCASEEAQAND